MLDASTQVRVVFITAPRGEPAERVARDLVEGRLAACVNIVSAVRSIYRWEGRVCDESEDLLVVKTTADRVDDLLKRVRETHPYQLPEVIVLPVVAGSDAYLQWVAEGTRL